MPSGFYPNNEAELRSLLKKLFENGEFGPGAIPKPQGEGRSIIGGISPQAGLKYSGYASAQTFYHLFEERIPDTVIILAPDLTGACRGKAAFGLNNWSIPSGILEIDLELARELKDSGLFNVEEGTYLSSPALKQLGLDHNVHSIEIQLTFIKFLSGGKKINILPIIIPLLSLGEIDVLAIAIHKAIKEVNKDIIVIASASMYHAQDSEKDKYRQLDQEFIADFSNFEIEKAYHSLADTPNNGKSTIPLLMLICKYLGAKNCIALKYYTVNDLGYSPPYSVAYFSGICSLTERLDFEIEEYLIEARKIDEIPKPTKEVELNIEGTSWIFKDRAKLEPDVIPNRIPSPEKEISLLSQLFFSLITRPNTSSKKIIVLKKKFEIGLILNLFGNILKDTAEKRDVVIHYVHENLTENVSMSEILNTIAESINLTSTRTIDSNSEKIKSINDHLVEEDAHLLLVLDDLHYFKEDLSELVTTLGKVSYNDNEYCSIIATIPNTDVLNQLSMTHEALQILKQHIVRIQSYTPAQLLDILKYQSNIGLQEGVISDSDLNLVALAILKIHDFRYGYLIMQLAGDLAEYWDIKTIDTESVNRAIQIFKRIYNEDRSIEEHRELATQELKNAISLLEKGLEIKPLALTDIEELIGEEIPEIDRIEEKSFGYVIKNNEVVALGLYEKEFTELPDSINSLEYLEELNLSCCYELTRLPNPLTLSNLKTLSLSNCHNLVSITTSLPHSLEYLDLSNCFSLTKLPDDIAKFTRIKYLDLSFCENLLEIPKFLVENITEVITEGCLAFVIAGMRKYEREDALIPVYEKMFDEIEWREDLCGKVFDYSEDIMGDVQAKLNLLDEMMKTVKKCGTTNVFSCDISTSEDERFYDQIGKMKFNIIIGCQSREDAVDVLLRESSIRHIAYLVWFFDIERYGFNDLREELFPHVENGAYFNHPLIGWEEFLEVRKMFESEPLNKETTEMIEIINDMYGKKEGLVSLERIFKALIEKHRS